MSEAGVERHGLAFNNQAINDDLRRQLVRVYVRRVDHCQPRPRGEPQAAIRCAATVRLVRSFEFQTFESIT